MSSEIRIYEANSMRSKQAQGFCDLCDYIGESSELLMYCSGGRVGSNCRMQCPCSASDVQRMYTIDFKYRKLLIM